MGNGCPKLEENFQKRNEDYNNQNSSSLNFISNPTKYINEKKEKQQLNNNVLNNVSQNYKKEDEGVLTKISEQNNGIINDPNKSKETTKTPYNQIISKNNNTMNYMSNEMNNYVNNIGRPIITNQNIIIPNYQNQNNATIMAINNNELIQLKEFYNKKINELTIQNNNLIGNVNEYKRQFEALQKENYDLKVNLELSKNQINVLSNENQKLTNIITQTEITIENNKRIINQLLEEEQL